jgi:hypothetical protein
MSRHPQEPLSCKDIKGLKYLKVFTEILEPLRQISVHGNRQFFMEEYVSLMLLHFFNPVLGSLRSLQQATGLENVQEVIGVKRTSLGAMSESAGKVFDPELMIPIIEEVISKIGPLPQDGIFKNLPGVPIAVDGTFLQCLPKMMWAVFRTQSDKRGAKLHLQFDIERGMPVSADITEALSSEKKALAKRLKAGNLYIVDRGYIDYKLYQAIDDAGSFFVARLKDINAFEKLEDRPLEEADRKANIASDHFVKMGSVYTEGQLTARVRRILVRDATGYEVALLTNTVLPAEVVTLLYRHRWQVELFFRWFKCILGCTHWMSITRSGLTLQIYIAILASLLIRLWTGRKPTRRTFEMICLYFQGWASEVELLRHIESLKTVA